LSGFYRGMKLPRIRPCRNKPASHLLSLISVFLPGTLFVVLFTAIAVLMPLCPPLGFRVENR